MTKLYPILDTYALQTRGCTLITAASAMLAAGARLLQIRHKGHWSRDVLTEAEAVRNLCVKHSAQLIVNDRADYAMLLNAGLHLGQDDLSPTAARRLAGQQIFIGYSTHNAGQLADAAKEPADYLALGPIFGTLNKDNPDPLVGILNLAAWRNLTPRPLVAIGGITRSNALQVLAAGADSLAVIGDLLPECCNEYALSERYDEWVSLLSS